jgi:hypothetical protein
MRKAIAPMGIATLAALVVIASSSASLAQAGSTGGVIGKTDKSMSGGEEEAPRRIRSTKKSSPRADTGSSSRRGGRDGGAARYDGTWTLVMSPGCVHSGPMSVTVSGGRLSALALSGTVSPTGVFHGLGVDGTVGYLQATGNTGKGTYREANGCSGTVTATKN